jgi:hypothetical protein
MAQKIATSSMLDPMQYEMLKRCFEKKDFTEWDHWRENNPNEQIHLVGAKFKNALIAVVSLGTLKVITVNLSGADLTGADFQGAVLCGSNFKEADLTGANLKGARLNTVNLIRASLEDAKLNGAILTGARLNGTSFNGSHIEGAKVHFAQVDSETYIVDCTFDKETDFTGTGLDSAGIDPGIKAALKDNIRRIQWQKWFAKGNCTAQALKNCFVRPFWWMTGYGSSTANIIYYFVSLAYLFGSLYFFLEVTGYSVVEGLGVVNMPWYHTWLRGLYFSVVTMTTLGFGDLYAMKTSYWGHVLLVLQVILGYVLLGALVTRLGILFTSEAPAAKPTPRKLKDKQSN